MSLTQLNFGSRSEIVKIQNASMSVAVHSDGIRMHSQVHVHARHPALELVLLLVSR